MIPGRIVDLQERAQFGSPRLCHRDVKAAEPVDAGSDRLMDVCANRDVPGRNADHFAKLPQLVDRLLERLGVAGCCDDAGSLLEKTVGDRIADATRGTGYENGLSVEPPWREWSVWGKPLNTSLPLPVTRNIHSSRTPPTAGS